MSTAKVGSTEKSVMLPTKSLVVKFFVRKELDPERVTYFEDLYKSGAEVEPIKVFQGTTEIFDGRHRHAALIRLSKKEAECVYVKNIDGPEKYAEAFDCNFGGALPPTTVDAVFVMRQLLEQGTPNKKVHALFAPRFFRPSHAARLLKDAHSQINKAKIEKARRAVANDDITVAQAAKKFDVELPALKKAVSGKKVQEKPTTAVLKAKIGNALKGTARRVNTVLGQLRDLYHDGEISRTQADTVLKHAKKLYGNGLANTDSWGKRIAAVKKK